MDELRGRRPMPPSSMTRRPPDPEHRARIIRSQALRHATVLACEVYGSRASAERVIDIADQFARWIETGEQR